MVEGWPIFQEWAKAGNNIPTIYLDKWQAKTDAYLVKHGGKAISSPLSQDIPADMALFVERL